MTSSEPRILLFSTRPDWVGAARLPGVLLRHGCRVGAICPEGALLTRVRGLRCLTFPRGVAVQALWQGLAQEVQHSETQLLIPCDDDAVRCLHELYARLAPADASASLKALLERSLGDPAHYAAVIRKSSLVEMSLASGVPVPASRVLAGAADALDFARQVGYPLLLKPDFGVAGRGIAACTTPLELGQAYERLSAQPDPLTGQPVRVTAQRQVRGPTAAVTLAAWQGRMLAGFCWLRERPFPDPFGLACLAQLHESPVMEALAARVVAYFGYSGLGSVQFVLDEHSGEPLVMEINARATPLGNLGEVFGSDLIGHLCAALTGEPAPARQQPRYRRVALFPNEWRRDPASPELHDPAVFHDVPWDQPELLAALLGGPG